MGIKLLHLSDIHFKDYNNHTFLDLDKDIQRELELDLGELIDQIGSCDLILIGGDIAFSGEDSQYAVAHTWIKKICLIAGCSEENVLTVPGNHDVERSKICPMLQEAQSAFKKLRDRVSIDKKLEQYLLSEDASLMLLKTFNNYNSFAQKYGAIPEKGNLLFWEKDINIGDATLRI